MRAVRIHGFGGPEEIRIEDVPRPEPDAERALVRIRAAGVNPVDWMLREKIYVPEGIGAFPITLGQDFAGVVERMPPGAPGGFREGDEVFGEAWGTFAEYAAVPVKDLVRKPRGLDDTAAAALPMPGLTAWQAIVDTAGAGPEMRFLVHGASGGVGSLAVQFARWKGAAVAATAGPESHEWLRSVGVDPVLDYRERFEDRLRDVDVVLDPRGGETQARSWAVLKRGGMLVNLVGDIDEEAARRAGVRAVEFAMRYDREDLEEIAGLVARGVVKPRLSKVMPLERAREALELNQQGRSHGKIVLQVG